MSASAETKAAVSARKTPRIHNLESLNDLSQREKAKIFSDRTQQERQQRQAKTMQERFAANCTVKVGTIVCFAVDIRDRSQCNPSGILAIVFAFKHTTGGVRLVCEHGVIGKGQNGRNEMWVPSDMYCVRNDNQTLPKRLKAIRDAVIAGTFDERNRTHISTKRAQMLSLGHDANGRRKCKCKNQRCRRGCGCVANGSHCNSGCMCGGNCDHTKKLQEAKDDK